MNQLRIFRSTSGNSSKFEVSSMERMLTEMAAGRSRMCSQSTPRKKLYDFKSSSPRWDPARRSASQQNLFAFVSVVKGREPKSLKMLSHLRMVWRASSDIGTSGGKMRVSLQFITLRYVSWGFSLQNGGYPISISYIMTPKLHQSQADP